MHDVRCGICDTPFEFKWIYRKKGLKIAKKYCSHSCSVKAQHIRGEIGFELKGEKSINWKGLNLSYGGLHNWIKRAYGKAKKCENLLCLGRSKDYTWAKIKGKKYVRKIENFMQLCRSCHISYDKRISKLKFKFK